MGIVMNLIDGFTHSKPWPAVLNERASISDEPAVYALVHQRAIGRLRGESQVLYIGRTGKLGGNSESCRLRIYRYPNGEHARNLRRRTEILIDAGIEVSFHWEHLESDDLARAREADLLARYMDQHWELPPFNGRR